MPSPEGGPLKPVSLTNILNGLCLYGKDVLVEALQVNGCLKQARLASNALRETVDDSIRRLRVFVNPEDAERVAAGQWFPLRRWSRLHRVTVLTFDADFITKLALPFMGQPPECMQQITELTLRSEHSASTVVVAVALSALLYRMPCLRCVHLHVRLLQEPLQQLVLFDALASLNQLEELHMEYNFATLQRIGALAGRLKSLTMSAVDGVATVAELCAVVAQMPALEVAGLVLEHLDRDGDTSALVQFLRCPPPRLRALHVSLSYDHTYWEVILASGRLIEVTQDFTEVLGSLEVAAQVAREVLLPLDVQLDQLRLSGIGLTAWGPGDGSDVDQNLQALRALGQRCGCVCVDVISIYCRFGVHRGLAAIRTLGLPHRLHICGHQELDYDLRKPTGPGGPVPQEHQGPHDRSSSVRGAALASELLVQQLAAAKTTACTAAAAASADGGLGSSSSSRMLHLVLLQSPLFSGLAWSPEALYVWMAQLAKRAAVEEEQAGAAAYGGAQVLGVQRYLPVPTLGAVVLECAAAGAAVAAAAAARGALAAAGFGQGTVVQVNSVEAPCLDTLLARTGQAFWDSGAGGSEAERLELLLEMGFELAEFSSLVELRRQGWLPLP